MRDLDAMVTWEVGTGDGRCNSTYGYDGVWIENFDDHPQEWDADCNLARIWTTIVSTSALQVRMERKDVPKRGNTPAVCELSPYDGSGTFSDAARKSE